ncbi:hypothetical protein LPJ63_003981 [Coemansia sp. RSA 2711]|nr:hypothetical protein LPJ63_003981 [Coemansia sp. RSA 2711]
MSLDDFKVVTKPAPTKDQLKEGELLLRLLYMSCDPMLRSLMSGVTDGPIPSFQVGKPIRGLGIGVVEASASPGFDVGDTIVGGWLEWQTVSITPAEGFIKILPGDIPAIHYLGALGVVSFTSYVGTVIVSQPKAGETLLVSGATGAVGQMVVQLAKARGLRVVAPVGSDDKVQAAKELGADISFNYKSVASLETAIKEAIPEGVDIYFDNVGGGFLDAAIANMNLNGRIAGCGMLSQYAVSQESFYRFENLMDLVTKRLSFKGFVVSDYLNTPAYAEFVSEVSEMLKQGKLTYKLAETAGIENSPQVLLDLFGAKNIGKCIVRI